MVVLALVFPVSWVPRLWLPEDGARCPLDPLSAHPDYSLIFQKAFYRKASRGSCLTAVDEA